MNQQPMNNIPLDKTTGLLCEKCEGEVFAQTFLLRKLSRFVTGDQQDRIIPLTVFACLKCNHVNEDFIPAELRHTYAEVIEE